MKLVKAILISTIMFWQLISCKDTGTGPNQKSFKDPQQMRWTADTLKPFEGAIQLLPENLLVFAPDDAWLVCYSDVAKGLLWHFDGKAWKSVDSGGGKRYQDLAGYNSDDFWLGGYSGDKIYLEHKVGNAFTRYVTDIKGEILDMTMDSQGNIWACGRNGFIAKYNKAEWEIDSINVGYKNVYKDSNFWIQGIEYYDNKIYALASLSNVNQKIEIYYFLSGQIRNWVLVDSMVINSPQSTWNWGYRGLYTKGSSLFSYGLLGLWKLKNFNWEKLLAVDGSINGVWAKDNEYLFAGGDFNNIYFFDGTSWSNVKDILNVKDPNFVFRRGWTDGNESFIIGYTFQGRLQQTIIWHGK